MSIKIPVQDLQSPDTTANTSVSILYIDDDPNDYFMIDRLGGIMNHLPQCFAVETPGFELLLDASEHPLQSKALPLQDSAPAPRSTQMPFAVASRSR
jgi:hypothetical protein